MELHNPEFFRKELEKELAALSFSNRPPELYNPVYYMLSLGGKRIRPALVLTACEMFGGDYRQAMPAALAIEMFHNFTLVHDDIMDEAPIRRGKETVYKKWNTPIAILVGDTMLSIAYDLLLQQEKGDIRALLALFNQTSVEVCEGQQMDMNFESRKEVSINEYIEMIRLKTSVLLASSLKTGGIIAGAGPEDCDRLYRFGEAMGLAFQLKDDYLDVYGDKALFGKQDSGDIVTNKKTFLILKALEKASAEDRALLGELYSQTPDDPSEKIKTVKMVYDRYDIRNETMDLIGSYYEKAMNLLDEFGVKPERLTMIRAIAEQINTRKH